jgi:hypothetical protein
VNPRAHVLQAPTLRDSAWQIHVTMLAPASNAVESARVRGRTRACQRLIEFAAEGVITTFAQAILEDRKSLDGAKTTW